MKKLIHRLYLIISTFSILGVNILALADGGQIASGGGGIYKYGRPVTFGTANFYTNETALELNEIPELSHLVNFFLSTPYLSEKTKANYSSSLIPTRNRSYYLVKENTFTQITLDRLIESYMRALKINKKERKNIRIYAITDTNKNETYLLPDFYLLNAIEKQAILFHEALWIQNPNANYQDVIDAEIKFQKYLEANTTERLMNLLSTKFFSYSDEFTAAVKSDMKHGYLKKLMPEGKLHFATLFGKNWLDCHNAGGRASCKSFIKNNILSLSFDPELSQSAFIHLLKSAKDVTISSMSDHIDDFLPYEYLWMNQGAGLKDAELKTSHPFYSASLNFDDPNYYSYGTVVAIKLDYYVSITNYLTMTFEVSKK